MRFLEPECFRKDIPAGSAWNRIFNIRNAFHAHFRMEKGGVAQMLSTAGLVQRHLV